MRNLSMFVVVICGTSSWAHAESLYLNPAQTQPSRPLRTYSTPAAVAPLPTYTTATVTGESTWSTPATNTVPTAMTAQPLDPHLNPVPAGCPCGGHPHGGMGHYPGGCCEPDASCCAALWANYCAQKKPCWQPHSPRRHAGGGFCLPALNFFHCDAFTSLRRSAPCDCVAPCDSRSLSVTPLPKTEPFTEGEVLSDDESEGFDGQAPVDEGEAISPSDLPTDALPEQPDVAPADEELVQPVPPAPEGAMRRKLGFPFSWKPAPRAKSNPFNKLGKKSSFSFSTAR